MNKILSLYRWLPWFKGKLRLGKFIFRNYVNKDKEFTFKAHYQTVFSIPNTLENIGLELMINGVYEREIFQFLKATIADNSVFFDIGANIGSVGIPIIKRKKNIFYHCFEATPSTFKYLVNNLERNGLKNCYPSNRLVHKADGMSHRFYVSSFHGKNSLAPTYSNDFIEVKSITIDSYCIEMNIEKIDWLKVDVQGFELHVFEGASEALKNKKICNILFENESWAEDQAKIPRGEALQYLRNHGYSLYDLNGMPWKDNHSDEETMIWAKISD